MVFWAFRPALFSLAAIALFRVLDGAGILRFESNREGWEWAVGIGVGILVGKSIPHITNLVKWQVLDRFCPVKVVKGEPAACLVLAKRSGFLKQMPLDFLNPTLLLFTWDDRGFPKTGRMRLATWYISTDLVDLALGLALCAIGYDLRLVDTFASTAALFAGLLTLFDAVLNLAVPKSGNQPPTLRQYRDIAQSGHRFESQVRRATAVQYELLSDWVPGTPHLGADQCARALRYKSGDSQYDALDRFAGLRMTYLSALGRRDWQAARGLADLVQNEIWTDRLPNHARDCASLLLAFHCAYIDGDSSKSRSYLSGLHHPEYLAGTPIYLLATGLNALLDRDFRTAGKQIGRAQRKTCSVRWLNGVAQLWLELIAGIVGAIPEPHRPSLRFAIIYPDAGPIVARS